jgi:tetratricopeptide (TPR) repeat protein
MKPMMTDLNRLLSRQNFKDEKELQAFLNNFQGKSIDDLPEMDLTPEEQAQDLVYEAYELTPAKAKKKIEEALKLDSNCIEAYLYLASKEKKAEKVLETLDKGIAIGRKKFGGKFLKQNKGDFWGIHETRPFMSCLFQKANLLMYEEKTAESVAIMEEMLELNDGDNQGVRYPLLSALITLGDAEKFKKYDKMFAGEKSVQMLYSRALFAFITEGASANAHKKLTKAFEANPFVVKFLFDKDFQFSESKAYSPGSPEEAENYLSHALIPWYSLEGAMEWLIETVEKIISKKISAQKKPESRKMWVKE